jgi:glycine dehydrogenase subunit 1
MRYLPLTPTDRSDMLATVGARSVDELFKDVPASARLPGKVVGLPDHLGELEVERAFLNYAAKNVSPSTAPFFIGAGAYRHHVPSTVDYMIQRGEFLTSYTPYQPEITQGTLQYLFEFQTQVSLLTGMEVANASMYDGSTAASEAVLMANRITRRTKALISGGLHPHYRTIIETTAHWQGYGAVAGKADPEGLEDLIAQVGKETSCVVVQNPSFFGHVRDFTKLAAACHAAGALLIVVVTEVVSLGLIKPPGEMGADIVVCEGQSIGNGLGFGGPYVGLFATRDKYVRQMPGRLVGETVDADGKRGFVLTLSTREQHIRREKATSNICTNAGLCALAFTVHLTLLGEAGFRRLAEINHAKASELADRVAAVPGVKLLNDSFFNEFTVRLPKPAAPVVEALADRRILAGVPVSRLIPDDPSVANLLLLAATETATEAGMAPLIAGLKEVL